MTDMDNFWSKNYSEGFDYAPIRQRSISKLLSYVTTDDIKRHLDIGCGTGQLTREMYHRGYESVGIDPSVVAIELAKAGDVRGSTTYYHGALDENTDILRHEAPFSFITTKLVYAFIENKTQFLGNVSRVMAESALFTVMTPHLEHVSAEKQAIATDRDETIRELSDYFNIVDSYKSDNEIWTTYICRK